MKTLLQINVVVNSGSTGRIAEDIGNLAISKGWKSYISYGRGTPHSNSTLIKIGNGWDVKLHGVETRLFDNHGLASKHATMNFIKEIEKIKPDIIHLHNIHGYYLNYKILFNYLSHLSVPIVWTLHDCWPITGHCSHFMFAKCDKWKIQCSHCPLKKDYPSSLLLDRSENNYIDKEKSFTSIKRMTIVPVSDWLSGVLKDSFLKVYDKCRIYNGINLNIFHFIPEITQTKKRYNIGTKYVLLGVASNWRLRKGLDDFFKLRNSFNNDFMIVLVGLDKKILNSLPDGICGIEKTESPTELAAIYSMANVYINMTLEDTFPTTNLESMACGTPVVTYNTGGCGESVSCETGFVVDKGDVDSVAIAAKTICANGKERYLSPCRERANKYYNKDDRFNEYINLYNSLI